jgi:hypothetical protein
LVTKKKGFIPPLPRTVYPAVIAEWPALDLTPTQLKLLKLVQCGFHLLLMYAGLAPAHPIPALHQKFLL